MMDASLICLTYGFGKERSRRWCANFSTPCPLFATACFCSSRGPRISLNEWALEIARFCRLAFELPSPITGRLTVEFATERTDRYHGYRYPQAEPGARSLALLESHRAGQFPASGFRSSPGSPCSLSRIPDADARGAHAAAARVDRSPRLRPGRSARRQGSRLPAALGGDHEFLAH